MLPPAGRDDLDHGGRYGGDTRSSVDVPADHPVDPKPQPDAGLHDMQTPWIDLTYPCHSVAAPSMTARRARVPREAPWTSLATATRIGSGTSPNRRTSDNSPTPTDLAPPGRAVLPRSSIDKTQRARSDAAHLGRERDLRHLAQPPPQARPHARGHRGDGPGSGGPAHRHHAPPPPTAGPRSWPISITDAPRQKPHPDVRARSPSSNAPSGVPCPHRLPRAGQAARR